MRLAQWLFAVLLPFSVISNAYADQLATEVLRIDDRTETIGLSLCTLCNIEENFFPVTPPQNPGYITGYSLVQLAPEGEILTFTYTTSDVTLKAPSTRKLAVPITESDDTRSDIFLIETTANSNVFKIKFVSSDTPSQTATPTGFEEQTAFPENGDFQDVFGLISNTGFPFLSIQVASDCPSQELLRSGAVDEVAIGACLCTTSCVMPEPGSLVILASALLGFLAFRRRTF